MTIRLVAFDLDGTLLTSDKRLSPANRAALTDIVQSGVRVALASGRLGSSMALVAADINFDVAMMTLNGAEVFTTSAAGAQAIYSAPLDARYADELIHFGRGKSFAINYYLDGKLYSVKNNRTQRWLEDRKSVV
jgi:HAD superfamily hydrolase (TIGR01484 family)